MESPDIRYLRSGDTFIAHQVVGEGPIDLLLVTGIFSNLDRQWEEPSYARFLERLASFSRLILFDPPGTGLSDRAPVLPTFEQQIDDVMAVLDEVGSERAAVMGISQGGPMAVLLAATHPKRTRALILYGTYPCAHRDAELPFGRSDEWIAEYIHQVEERWGQGTFVPQVAPSRASDQAFRRWWVRFERAASAPGNARAYIRINTQVDVRKVLPTIAVPTLVLQRREDLYRDPRNGRYLAEHIAGARYVELEGIDHLPYVGDSEAIAEEIEEFLTGARSAPEQDRSLATVLFTDIVGSTELAAELGDRRWRDLLEEHHGLVRRALARFRGHEVDTAGDGFLATFDGPARAIRCARTIVDQVGDLGMEIRAGLHTGECEFVGDQVRGIAVHIGARVAALARPGEVLLSSTVKDLAAGSGIDFEDRGEHRLKGIPQPWRLFAAAPQQGLRGA